MAFCAANVTGFWFSYNQKVKNHYLINLLGNIYLVILVWLYLYETILVSSHVIL